MITLTVPELQQLIINDDTGERFAPPSVMRSLVAHLELECRGRSIDLRADGSYFFVDTDHEVATVIPFDRDAGGWPLERIPEVVAPGADADASEHQFIVTVTGCSREQAQQVMAERLNVDEDYGFDYTIGYTAGGMIATGAAS